ncbi:hypothetical protein TraAM80_03036 [Trypanosoma rangeli]|uniref:Uncharacterized protein n=1 Tax=Trypanosoma rangeli TaxID=5698 RepID=A0A3R7KIB3_TRYRA|nr:uncharacterized protein TraAM80_03036 [Trypanosoma rangeli]RNF08182.1 hypothetical protein TraAM80_03036 [Trypanosoma rangeli]|eukprot:RNF08182.1 hypothetical protein TraAM80_03036 [Trypanosoma rangeli]
MCNFSRSAPALCMTAAFTRTNRNVPSPGSRARAKLSPDMISQAKRKTLSSHAAAVHDKLTALTKSPQHAHHSIVCFTTPWLQLQLGSLDCTTTASHRHAG